MAGLGLGGKPALVELGVFIGGIFIRVEVGVVFSIDRAGISRDVRLGRLGCCTDAVSSLSCE